MGTRRRRAALAGLAVAVLGAGTTVAVTTGAGDAPRSAGTRAAGEPSPSPTGPPVRAALLPPARPGALPSRPRLEALVQQSLADPALGGALAVSIVDAATGRPLYERAADRPVLPASTAKIATATAALVALPADLRLTTRVVAGAGAGEVVLLGGGDATLAGPAAEPAGSAGFAPARLSELARRVRAALGGAQVRRVLVDESLYTGARLAPGWKPGYVTEGAVAPVGPLALDGGRVRPDRLARTSEPGLAAGRALAELLQPGAGVPVQRGAAPADARPLGAVQSPPVPWLVERMLVRSDNDLAEALARQVALAEGQPASFAGAAAAVAGVLDGVLAQAGARPGAVRLVDGSGLSRANRLEPAALTRLLARAASGEDPRLGPLLTGLPVAGFDGTLSLRYRTGRAESAAGAVRAKTGTLNGISALAGLLRTADGRLLAFDLTADSVPLGSTRSAERALDALAARIAACGCP